MESHLKHPVNQFRLIRRYHKDWPYIRKLLGLDRKLISNKVSISARFPSKKAHFQNEKSAQSMMRNIEANQIEEDGLVSIFFLKNIFFSNVDFLRK